MGPLGYTHLNQGSRDIARFRPEVIEANVPRGATRLESLVWMNFQGYTSARTLAREVVQFSFGYVKEPLNPVFRSTAPQTP